MKLAITVIFTAVVIGVVALLTAQQNESSGRGGWNREGAAKYLDERMDIWFTNANQLRTGQAKTACVSCHMTVPYALARPVLRRVMNVTAPTTQEIRLLDAVKQRVETYSSHQLLYESSEGKKTESRGTEAVLNALVLANAEAGLSRGEFSEPIRKAFARLWETQRQDGAWDWIDSGLEPFESADAEYHGVALAAFAVGMITGISPGWTPVMAAGIEKLRGFLRDRYSAQNLFNRTWALLASIRLKDLLTQAQRETLIVEIQGRQQSDGGWSLEALGPWRWSKSTPLFRAPGSLDTLLLKQSDGYATGLIVYTLRAAGFPMDHPVVSKGLQWLGASQRDVQDGQHTWHAWRAYSLNFDREHGGKKGDMWPRFLMSDAATAFAVLALAAPD